jgi:hypothetical protein
MIHFWEMVEEPMLPQETIPRRYKHGYLAIVAQERIKPVDLERANNLYDRLLTFTSLTPPFPSSYRAVLCDEAKEHMLNAMNPDLPLQTREQHFDIAGSKVWECYWGAPRRTAIEEGFIEWMNMWREAGGI